MADRTIKMADLKSILNRYGVGWSEQRGTGSHILFSKEMDGGIFTYPIPTHGKDVLACYLRGVRKKFKLRAEDGVADKDFYSKS
ncbi:type II toxin-antitoxin system HicA family toxin [Singulisphaera rosea]